MSRLWARSPHAFWREIRDRPRPGSPYLLEPDLKEGAGGRRDFDELTWSAALLTSAPQHDPGALVEGGILTRAEIDALSAAAVIVAAARWELQRSGFGDTMSLESLESLDAVDAEDVQAALGETALLLARARARIAGKIARPGRTDDRRRGRSPSSAAVTPRWSRSSSLPRRAVSTGCSRATAA